jgi:hypothetical protein
VQKQREARATPEHWSRKFKISTGLPSANCQGVASACQVSLGQLGGRADEGGLGSFLGLRCDQAVAFEDAPDGGHRGRLRAFLDRWKWMV